MEIEQWFRNSQWKWLHVVLSIGLMLGIVSLSPLIPRLSEDPQWLKSAAILREVNGSSVYTVSTDCLNKTTRECLLNACIAMNTDQLLIAVKPNDQICPNLREKMDLSILTLGVACGLCIILLVNYFNVITWRNKSLLVVLYIMIMVGHLVSMAISLSFFLIEASQISDVYYFSSIINCYYMSISFSSIGDFIFLVKDISAGETKQR
jgi:hypothetical protein